MFQPGHRGGQTQPDSGPVIDQAHLDFLQETLQDGVIHRQGTLRKSPSGENDQADTIVYVQPARAVKGKRYIIIRGRAWESLEHFLSARMDQRPCSVAVTFLTYYMKITLISGHL